jgi:hypothetical protein
MGSLLLAGLGLALKLAEFIARVFPMVKWGVDRCQQLLPERYVHAWVTDGERLMTEKRVVIGAKLTFIHKWGRSADINKIYWEDNPHRKMRVVKGTTTIGNGSITVLLVCWSILESSVRRQAGDIIVGDIRVETSRWEDTRKNCRALPFKTKKVWPV